MRVIDRCSVSVKLWKAYWNELFSFVDIQKNPSLSQGDEGLFLFFLQKKKHKKQKNKGKHKNKKSEKDSSSDTTDSSDSLSDMDTTGLSPKELLRR